MEQYPHYPILSLRFMPHKLSKFSASRDKNKIKLFIFYYEAKPKLFKFNTSRAENKANSFIFSSEPEFKLSKFRANRGKNKINYLYFIYWRHLIIKSVAKTVIEGKVHKVTTVTDHILYPIGLKHTRLQ